MNTQKTLASPLDSRTGSRHSLTQDCEWIRIQRAETQLCLCTRCRRILRKLRKPTTWIRSPTTYFQRSPAEREQQKTRRNHNFNLQKDAADDAIDNSCDIITWRLKREILSTFCVMCKFFIKLIEEDKGRDFRSLVRACTELKIQIYESSAQISAGDMQAFLNLSMAMTIINTVPNPNWARLGQDIVVKHEEEIACIRVDSGSPWGYQRYRARPPRLDITLLRRWLDCCEKEHSMWCVPVLPKKTIKFRLIDTVQNRIVSVASNEDKRYVALSYVWGGDRQRLMLTLSNEAYLRDPEALLFHVPSQTILDAMDVVRRMGERYLWVDALCVRQDDAEDLASSIPDMGHIYQHAAFTIVAAAGNTAEASLPGLRDRDRDYEGQIVNCAGIRLLAAAEPALFSPSSPSSQSNYNRRGWTFQERILSPRCLIFTAEQVYWECRSRLWSENMPDGEYYIPGPSLRLSSLQSDPKPIRLDRLVAQYTSRELSYSKDALNAFMGTLALYTEIYREVFFWALPTTNFSHQLGWTTSINKSRDGLIAGSQADFPTWSWLSWQGQVSLMTDEFTISDTPLPIYKLEANGHTKHVRRVLGPGQADSMPCNPFSELDPLNLKVSSANRRSSVTDQDIEQLDSSTSSLLRPDFHILFWAYTATAMSTTASGNCHCRQDSNDERSHGFVKVGPCIWLHVAWQDGIAVRSCLIESDESDGIIEEIGASLEWKLVIMG